MNPQGAFQGNIARTPSNAYEKISAVNKKSINGYYERQNILNQRAQG